ncbi:MAG: S41 family peptidase [Chloroflexota bacterium]
MRLQATSTGGIVDGVTPAFTDVSEDVRGDFKLFADAVEGIAAANPQLSAALISDSAIEAMVMATPDCFTVYFKTDTDVPVSAGLQWRLLGGNVGYVAWHAFIRDSSYDIQVEVRKALDALLAQGARAWLFDWRDNYGGATGTIADWFLNGEPLYVRVARTGAPTTATARSALRLPAAYQLPIAVLMNRRSIAASEAIAVAWRENHRATIIGAKSPGCVGSNQRVVLPGGGSLIVANEEFVGAVTGTHYANAGIEPDIASDDATAIDVATKLLQSKVVR